MEIITILAIALIFACSILSAWYAKRFKPGTFLLYGQAFASGSFLSISLLHYSTKAATIYDNWSDYPWYSFIIIVVFIFFSLGELIALNDIENRKKMHFIGEDSSKGYDTFLSHHFDVVPSTWLQIVVYIFLILHSVILGFSFSTMDRKGA